MCVLPSFSYAICPNEGARRGKKIGKCVICPSDLRDLSKNLLMIPFSFAVVKVEICFSLCELPISETLSEQKKMCDQKNGRQRKNARKR